MPSGVYPDTHKHEKARGLSRNKYDTKGNLRKPRASRAKPPVYPINEYGDTDRHHYGGLGGGSKIRREHVRDEYTRKIIPNHEGELLEGQERITTYGSSTRKIRSDVGKPRGKYKQGPWNEAKGGYERAPYTDEEQKKRDKGQSITAKGEFGPELESDWYNEHGWGSESNRQNAIAETEKRKLNFMKNVNYTGNRDRPKRPKKPPAKPVRPPMPTRAPPKPARPPMPKRAPPKAEPKVVRTGKKVKFRPKKKKEEPKKEEPKKGEENKGKIYKGKFKIKKKTKVI